VPTFTDESGITISYEHWPAAEARAVIQIVHGVGEYAGRYEELAGELNAAGYTVYADDHRGHGQTGLLQAAAGTGGLGKLGPGGMHATIAAIHQLSDIIKGEAPHLPLVLLGHSWGSLIAQILVEQHPVEYDALVLSGTAYRMVGSMAAGGFNKRWAGPGTTGYEWLSRDAAVSRDFEQDPLTFYADTVKVFGISGGLQLFGRPKRDYPRQFPVLIALGSEDPVGGEQSALKLATAYRERSGLTDVTLKIYQGARHEIYKETNRAEVIADLIHWLGKHVPSSAAASTE
jgi:alpha-beta hydrolase superfamily lysophospholipase